MGQQSQLMEIYQRLANDPRCRNADIASFSGLGPMLTMRARIHGQDLSLFTMMAEFTTAQDVAMSERRVELFFAADEPTRHFFESLQSSGG